MRVALALSIVLSASSFALAQDFVVHTFDKLKLSDKFYSEGAHWADINKDGQGDFVAGPYWYQGPDFKSRSEIYPPKEFNINGYSDNFLLYTQDVNADEWSDVIVLGFPGKAAYWYENPKGAKSEGPGHWKKHHIMDVVDNESPMMADITGDGKPELICSTGGKFGYATPAADPTQKWNWHVISGGFAGGMFTHGLGVGDVNGDGKADLMWKDGWLEQPASLDGDPEWKKHGFKFGSGGAQMYAYDFDGDGDQDIVTSLQAHQYGLAWFEQVGKKDNGDLDFKQHIIVGTKAEENPYGIVYTQMHAVELVDMDGDGLKDIITGKRFWAHNGNDPGEREPAVLFWYKTVRKGPGQVEFIPYLIDQDSGVGTQVTVADINGDKLPDILVGNKKGQFVFLHRAKKATEEEWKLFQPKKTADLEKK